MYIIFNYLNKIYLNSYILMKAINSTYTIKPQLSLQTQLFSNYIQAGTTFTGFQKSLSKKSEYFFSELDVTITSIDTKRAKVCGLIDKKIISLAGKKRNLRVFFEGDIIDGVNHTFTSNLSSKCEALDIYFWNRFPSFKDIEGGLRGLREHSSRYIYLKWQEKGTLKTKLKTKKHTSIPNDIKKNDNQMLKDSQ